jgi:DNA-binding NtrC family response regulator
MNKDLVKIGPEAMRLLTNYHWPGNVRELENIIERALVIGTGKAIVPGDLPFGQGQIQEAEVPESIHEMERLHIKRILNNTAWNISQSARRLGIDRQTLYNKMQKYGLSRDE